MSRTICYQITLPFDGMKIYDYLRREQHLSYRLITSLKHLPLGITLGGEHARTIDSIKVGDTLCITMPERAEPEESLSSIRVDIAYEDEDVLVYNKPAGMNCHQSRRQQNDTLANVFAADCARRGVSLTFRCINRLDKNTSGLVMLAKNQHAAALLKDATEKEYLALVHGNPPPTGTVDAPISRINDVYTKRQVDAEGQPACTHFAVLAKGEGYSLLRLWLETGRTHQIRVHMAHIGHPLAGDDMYGGNYSVIARQALHCANMAFISPISGECAAVTAPLPEDIQNALLSARIYSNNE